MKTLLGVVVLVCALALPFVVVADDEQVPSEKEVSQAEAMPPLAPHALSEPDRDGFFSCLSCHGNPKVNAPQTPHPDRVTCTQCHLSSDPEQAPKPRKR
jgi:cytochrome c-type protein NapB